MLKQAITGLIGVWLATSGQVAAQGVAGTVVELYTSQGCSSCPPADAYLTELATDPGVIALALHIDYWDYIGWTDMFADPKYTLRQKAYARDAGSNTIYTPQMIVGGVERVEGTNPMKVEGNIRRHQMATKIVTLQLTRDGGTIYVTASADPPLTEPLNVQLVRYRPKQMVKIEYGENAGMVMEYTNIVTSWSRVGEWSGPQDLQMALPVTGDDPVVVILQADGPGLIYAASVLK